MKVRFLLDENLSPRLRKALLRLEPTVDVLRVGDSDTPHLNTLDPEILHYLEHAQRILVTANRRSMPGHLEDHWANGGHIWGLLWIRSRASISEIATALHLIWELYEAEELIDVTDWIP